MMNYKTYGEERETIIKKDYNSRYLRNQAQIHSKN